ncbi:hypothetical protein EON65_47105 [archaeon]|nr:MAG: hypothetical protein EON65_47105 [archaeon]
MNIADEAAEFCTASYRSPELYDPIKGMQLDCRTDVWALGCLLFAWWFGYSPFECEFIYNTNRVRVVECSALRILANVPQPYTYRSSADDRLVYDLTDSILQKNLALRMFVPEIVAKVSQHLGGNNRDVMADA